MSLFDDDANRKFVPSKMHKLIHAREPMVACMQSFLKKLDDVLYSEPVRSALQTVVLDPDIKTALANADATREHVYRFHLRGDNSLFLVVYYLQNKYGVNANYRHIIPRTSWDTSLFINPCIPDVDFTAIIDTLIPYVLRKMMHETYEIASDDFRASIHVGLDWTIDFLTETNKTEYLDYKYEFINKSSPLAIFNESDEYKESLRGQVIYRRSAAGTFVSSNRTPFEDANFYLARILANVFANPKSKSSAKCHRMPVEIFDFSIPYKGSYLSEAWESYREYHIKYRSYDFRVFSHDALYWDLVNIKPNHTRTRKNIRKLNRALDEILVPYKKIIDMTNIRIHVSNHA